MERLRFFSARHWWARFFGPREDSHGQVAVTFAPIERRPRKAATVDLVGVELRLSAGDLGVRTGVASTLVGVALHLAAGRPDVDAIQNPTAEELAALLALDAVTGD